VKSLVVTFSLLCLACVPAASPGQEATSTLANYDLESRPEPWVMPGRLDEISGLAITADGRLFGHNDERATVTEIDRITGEAGKRFSLGDPIMEGDFEGIAIVGERFFLITSQGMLYEFREAGDRETSPHRVTDTDLGAICEAEGLDYDPADDALLIACKTSTPDLGTIVIYRLPMDPSRPRLEPIEIQRSELPAFHVREDFQASSIAVTPSGSLLLASAAPEALLEVDRSGRVIGGFDLPGGRHPQSEGLAFGPDGTLFIADEQNDGPNGHVTPYPPVRR
jgi:uncharacterized protein YjiK